MTEVPSTPVPAPAVPTLGWALRRALLGITIMIVVVAGSACLLYFTIDSDAEARAEGDLSPRGFSFYVPKFMRLPQ